MILSLQGMLLTDSRDSQRKTGLPFSLFFFFPFSDDVKTAVSRRETQPHGLWSWAGTWVAASAPGPVRADLVLMARCVVKVPDRVRQGGGWDLFAFKPQGSSLKRQAEGQSSIQFRARENKECACRFSSKHNLYSYSKNSKGSITIQLQGKICPIYSCIWSTFAVELFLKPITRAHLA